MPSMAPRNRSLSVPIGNISPCPCHGMTAAIVLVSANVRLDQAPRISIAVKYRSAVVLLIMTVSPVMVWANDHSNKPWLRHQPRKLRLGQRFGHSRVIVERPFGVDNCLMHCDKASGGFCLKSRRQIALIPVQPRVAKRPEAAIRSPDSVV